MPTKMYRTNIPITPELRSALDAMKAATGLSYAATLSSIIEPMAAQIQLVAQTALNAQKLKSEQQSEFRAYLRRAEAQALDNGAEVQSLLKAAHQASLDLS